MRASSSSSLVFLTILGLHRFPEGLGRPNLPSEDQYYSYDVEDELKVPGAKLTTPARRRFIAAKEESHRRVQPPTPSSSEDDNDYYPFHYEEEGEDGSLRPHHKVPPRLAELEQLLESSDYDSYHASAWERGEAVRIALQLHIHSFASFRAEHNAFGVELTLRKAYDDERLRHHGRRHIILNEPHLIAKVWKPDLYFANAKETSMGRMTKPHQLLKVHPSGRVQHSMKLSAEMTCHASLHAYPVDSQECEIRIMSYAHPADELLLAWSEANPLTHDPDILLPDMNILSIAPHTCPGDFENETFSCVEARVALERKILGHLLQTYLPSAIIVAISWVSFWIDPYAVPARVTLSFTTLLTLTTQAAGLRVTAPAATGAKAMDYWMGVCTLFVLLALLEYTWVNSNLQKAHQTHLRQKQRKQRRRLELMKNLSEASSPTSEVENGTSRETTLLRGSSRTVSFLAEQDFKMAAYRIDDYSKLLFPALFLIFNIIYWSMLLSS